jgi:hypothetical protein
MQESQVCSAEFQTDMALNEADKKWLSEKFQPAHKSRIANLIKEWGSPAVAVVILIFAWTEWGTYVEFRTRTNDRLGTIETKLTTSELRNQVSLPQPAFEKALPDIRSTIAAARKDRISVPPPVIEGLRSKLLASSSAAPDFWPTLSELVSYRSALSYHAAVATQPATRPATPIGVYAFHLERVPDCTDSLPKPMTVKEVLSPTEATQNRGVYENCRFVLDSVTQGQKLNDILKGSTPLITFKNCLIEYHGGEINLILAWDKEPFTLTLVGRGPGDPSKIIHTTLSGPAIQFENCLFSFMFQNSPPPNGQRLSTTLLAENATSVSLPVSQ